MKKDNKPNTDPKDYIVKITPLVPGKPIFVDSRTINRQTAEFIALQKAKESGNDFNYYTTKVTEVK